MTIQEERNYYIQLNNWFENPDFNLNSYWMNKYRDELTRVGKSIISKLEKKEKRYVIEASAIADTTDNIIRSAIKNRKIKQYVEVGEVLKIVNKLDKLN